MPITPLPPADYEPEYSGANYSQTMGQYNNPGTFRFWCQKVLPLVYDDSLSYYELLCKVVDYLNKTMKDVNTAAQDVDDLNDSFNSLQQYTNDTFDEFKSVYNELQTYVNTYFSGLDVQEEIDNKLDEMVSDGTFNTLLTPYMQHYQDDLNLLSARLTTLETNYTPGGTTADSELSDIRVGYTGTAYPTAGDAVRGQVSDLHANIDDIVNLDQITITPVFTLTRNLNSSGQIRTNEMRAATVGFTPVTGITSIIYNVPTGFRIYICRYSMAAESAFLSNSGDWLTGSGTFNILTANYLRFGMASADDLTAVTQSDIANLQLSYDYDLRDQIQELTDKTYVYHETPIDTNLNQCTDFGVYNIRSSGTVTNAPAGYSGGGTLVVLNSYAPTGEQRPFTQLIQILFSTAIKKCWTRHCSTEYVWRDWIELGDFFDFKTIVDKTAWLAVGDSITYGVYSYIEDDEAHSSVTNNSWVKLLAAALNYSITVMASRGMGYTPGVTGQDPEDPTGDRISIDTLLTRIEALKDNFNLITLAFGINDYATSASSATIANITTSLTDAINRLQTKWPAARLVVITPFNSCRSGDASTNYSYNYPNRNQTLKDIADAIQSTCRQYGVECYYATNGTLLNNYNINALLPDKTHPSAECHRLIAKTLSHVLLY